MTCAYSVVTPLRQWRAIQDLTCLTRELGLTIQAAKTQIYNRTKASTAWRGYSSWLAELQEEELRKQLEDYFATFGPYDDPGDIDPDLIAVEQQALENLFALVTKNPADSVDRKGLDFVLRKLGQIPSDHAVEYCLDHLTELPDVAPRISKYIRHFSDRKEVQERVFKFASSDDCIYDWEMMHILAAMLDTQTLISNLSDRVLEIALDRNREVGLRSVCIDLMRNNGTQEIVREICRHFEGEPFEEVRAAIILCSQKLPSPERRGFLRQWKGISPALEAAVSIASEV